MVYGIVRDKERVDAGEPTEIIALHTRKEIEELDALAAKRGKEIDVTPADSGPYREIRAAMRLRQIGRAVFVRLYSP